MFPPNPPFSRYLPLQLPHAPQYQPTHEKSITPILSVVCRARINRAGQYRQPVGGVERYEPAGYHPFMGDSEYGLAHYVHGP